MKIFLDDVRTTPDGWVRCYYPKEVITLLKNHRVTEISLDHDLGYTTETGYDVLLWIEEQVVLNSYKPPKIYIHSDNASAIQKMRLAVQSIEKRSNT